MIPKYSAYSASVGFLWIDGLLRNHLIHVNSKNGVLGLLGNRPLRHTSAALLAMTALSRLARLLDISVVTEYDEIFYFLLPH
jgi:hypothetical protein